MSREKPDRLATWIITRCTSDYSRDSFLGDLMEQYQERGGWWYWRQALGAVRAHTGRLIVDAADTEVSATEYIADLILWVALGMCALIQLPIYAYLLISWTSLNPSDPSVVVASTMIGGAVIAAAAIARRIRMRAVLAT